MAKPHKKNRPTSSKIQTVLFGEKIHKIFVKAVTILILSSLAYSLKILANISDRENSAATRPVATPYDVWWIVHELER
jgi:hypothetical protein